MQTVLIVIHLMVVLALIGVVLIQRSEGGGLGIGGGGGGGGGFFSARGTANVLTRATAILAALFFLTSIGLTVLAGWGRGPTTIFAPAAQPGPSAPTPGATPDGAAPSGTVLDQLKGIQPAPSSPQVPQSQ
ncbi:preprotein translocase subunit SecG [Ancylobacter sp. 6x-1]|uniref:Protein-export membrane protein SecG n=1 Tax=Ancylobacter crimeensis TaxID=2579147 RepID=A0ABT0DCM5_9HYPH|nr:preprotein translocase subunit SecG [Ancylobacter crimeensis]MCK0197649.1 preprotein translocase subunit SecG [Ancylobacter crimeensis]